MRINSKKQVDEINQNDENFAKYQISPIELKKRIDSVETLSILDVREENEYNFCKIRNTKLVSLEDLPDYVEFLDTEQEIVLVCRTGRRSMIALKFLLDSGFTRVRNLKGGLMAWSDLIDNSIPKY